MPKSRSGERPARRPIGEVVAALRGEFPDVSISKVRFLEAEGLVTPERTASGYRTYSERDVERLRYVLAAQRDRFWPLKLIRESLDALDRGLLPAAPSDGPSARPAVPPAAADPHLPTPAEIARPGALRLTAQELSEASGLDPATVEALRTYGLLRPSPATTGTGRRAAGSAASAGGTGPAGSVPAPVHFDEADLAIARAAGALAGYGIEPRHLRAFRTAADREVGLVQQVVSPLRGRARPGDQAARGGASGGADKGKDGRKDVGESPADDPARDPVGEPVGDTTAAMMAHCIALHVALVRAGLRGH